MYLFRLLFLLLLSLITIANAQDQTLEKVSVQFEWKHQFEFAGFYAAKEKGFYKEAGLDVTINEHSPGIDTVENVLQGVSTYGISSSQLILDRLAGKKVVLLASYFKQNALVLITRPEIQSIEALKDKQIMGTTGELTQSSLAAMLQLHNLKPDDITVIPHSYDINAFKNGEVDAITAFISNEPFFLDQKQVSYKIFNPAEYGIYSYDVELFTSEKEATQHPHRTQRFINATRKGWKYALNHKEEIIDLIYEKYSKAKSKEALLYEAKITENLIKKELFSIGAIVPELIKLNTDLYVQLGMVTPDWDLDGFIFNLKPHKINLTPTESAFIESHPIIRCSAVSWKPFSSITGETYSGIFHEYYKLIEQRTGLKFEFVKIGDGVNFQYVLDALKRKEIDMIYGSGKTLERTNYALFAGPLMQASLSIVSHRENRFYTLESLKDKTIAVAKGSTASEYIKENFPTMNLLYTNSIDEALYKVSEQKADAVVDNLVVLDYMIRDNYQFHQIEITGINDDGFDIYGLIRDDYPILRQILDKAIRSVTQEELLSINNRLIRSTIQTTNPYDINLSTEELAIIRKNTFISLSKHEAEYLKEKKSLTLCVDPNWLPFEKMEKGKHIGMSAEYFGLISSRIGIPITVIPTTTWEKSLSYAKARKCDILSLSMETPSRKAYLDFTDPLLEVPLVITTTYDQFFISDISELRGKKIGIVKGYAFKELLQTRYPDIQFIEAVSIEEGLKSVIKGETFGFIDNLTAIGYQIQKNFPGSLKVSGKFNEKQELSLGVRNDEPALLGILNKAVGSIDEKTKENILNSWITIKYEQGFNYILLGKVLTPFVLIALLLLFRQSVLSKYNAQLKNEVEEKVKELRKKDKILLKKHRMAAMGEVLSLIAHQWKQPLSAISSTLMGIKVKLVSGQYNLNDQTDREKFLLYLDQKHNRINHYVEFLSNTTDDFRNFFNPNKHKESTSLLVPIRSALQIVQGSMQTHGINIKEDLRIDAELMLYKNEITQVVLNLLKNSEDNFLEKAIPHPEIIITTYTDQDHYIIRICDNGGGIPKEHINNIFDPYFSTKHEDIGTGLGLYMSKIIVEEHHGGLLNMYNTDQGVCFEIILTKRYTGNN
ncbi:transporter substrate-binding domain-containing protein [Sulfurovum sp. zt1-1]|uniref:histidine kinase n=1 Tax=Sulfurovum zhangzhouensis TaxID=3019067 RepID=A0ABT7QX00_9BACT|nr:transporter substrate-binding domain-containing protein [Sulfurovum zhangzhouensis]MDM5271318.1 transporter substrate-binding domain-containing protein [Sulfurovum zhangzhouensis]